MSNPLSYFKETYEECREAFLELAKTSGGELLSHPVLSKTDSNLSFESLYFPPLSGKKKELLILTSGIHGIEGFTGSALQRYFLNKNLFNLRREDRGILIIHGINPYGFKHERRVTENNVDLNRNFDTTPELFKNENSGYAQLRAFLNPVKRKSRPLFYTEAIFYILKFGMESLKKAILKGQYQFPEGIFFGGQSFEPQVSLIGDLVSSTAEGFEKALLVDLHTGYGERGRLHLFGENSSLIDRNYLKEIFQDHSIDYGQDKDFYTVTGGFTVFMAKLFQGKTRFAGVVFEFGTIDSQKTSGSLDSLYRMVVENLKTRNKSDRELYRELFYPSSPTWRKSVLAQFEAALSLIK